MMKYAEQYHIKLITMADVLSTDYGKIPYSKCVGVGYCQAYYADDVVYSCAEKPSNWVTPCKVSMDHLYFSFERNRAPYIGQYVHYMMYGKVMFPNAN